MRSPAPRRPSGRLPTVAAAHARPAESALLGGADFVTPNDHARLGYSRALGVSGRRCPQAVPSSETVGDEPAARGSLTRPDLGREAERIGLAHHSTILEAGSRRWNSPRAHAQVRAFRQRRRHGSNEIDGTGSCCLYGSSRRSGWPGRKNGRCYPSAWTGGGKS